MSLPSRIDPVHSGSGKPNAAVDSYLAAQPEKVRALLEKLRGTIRQAAPDAEEIISYRIPAYRYHGLLVFFAAFKNHCSFFPGSLSVIKKMAAELESYPVSRGTIRFTVEQPLPAALVKKMVRERVRQNLEKVKLKAKKHTKS
jgi:uncharacterized protein YdhG (YjbR/CyaY superfamily)